MTISLRFRSLIRRLIVVMFVFVRWFSSLSGSAHLFLMPKPHERNVANVTEIETQTGHIEQWEKEKRWQMSSQYSKCPGLTHSHHSQFTANVICHCFDVKRCVGSGGLSRLMSDKLMMIIWLLPLIWHLICLYHTDCAWRRRTEKYVSRVG